MTEANPPQPDPPRRTSPTGIRFQGTPEKKRVAIGCSVGATIETYDFVGFGTAAGLYFNTVFFPGVRPAVRHAPLVSTWRDPDGLRTRPWRKRGLYTGITQAGIPVG